MYYLVIIYQTLQQSISENTKEINKRNSQFADEKASQQIRELSIVSKNESNQTKMKHELTDFLTSEFNNKIKLTEQKVKFDIEDIKRRIETIKDNGYHFKNESFKTMSKNDLSEVITENTYNQFGSSRNKEYLLKDDDFSDDSMALYKNYLRVKSISKRDTNHKRIQTEKILKPETVRMKVNKLVNYRL